MTFYAKTHTLRIEDLSNPDLPTGHYQITVSLLDGKGGPVEHLVDIYVLDLTNEDSES